MDEIISVELQRDCEGIQIPLGTPLTLKAGTPARITQTLGGSYTVQCPDGLFRIAAKDADALGLEGGARPAPAAATKSAGAAEPVDEQRMGA